MPDHINIDTNGIMHTIERVLSAYNIKYCCFYAYYHPKLISTCLSKQTDTNRQICLTFYFQTKQILLFKCKWCGFFCWKIENCNIVKYNSRKSKWQTDWKWEPIIAIFLFSGQKPEQLVPSSASDPAVAVATAGVSTLHNPFVTSTICVLVQPILLNVLHHNP